MSCIQQNFPSKFEPNDAFYEKLEENTFVAFILKHPVGGGRFLFNKFSTIHMKGGWGREFFRNIIKFSCNTFTLMLKSSNVL